MSRIPIRKLKAGFAPQKAFSLIELVIVILVLGIACLGLALATQEVLFNIHRPEVISTAVGLAEARAERVLALNFASVNNQHRDSPLAYGGNFSAYSWEVRVDSLDDAAPSLGSDVNMTNYKVVDVRVHHPAVDHVSIVFLKTNY